MSDLSKSDAASPVQIVGRDEQHIVDVELISGKRKLLTDATVTVEQVFGADPFADSWFRIEDAGADGDTVRIQIAATTNDPSTPDRDAPAVDVTVNVTASEAGDEEALRDKIISELNADPDFSNSLKARAVKDNAIVHVSSEFRGEFWERTNSGDFDVSVTGSVSVTIGFDTLELRGKPTELQRSVDDPRQGILGFAGIVSIQPSAVQDIFQEFFEDSGSSNDMAVNGSGTPVEFTIDADPTQQKVIQFLTLRAIASNIKFGQFLGLNNSLTNGILVELKAQDDTSSFALMFDTEDLTDLWARTPDASRVSVQSGGDHINATKDLTQSTIILEPQGTFASDDFVKITIQDNLSSLTKFQAIAKGFLRSV